MKLVVTICLFLLSSFCSCTERELKSRIEYEQMKSDSGVFYVKRTFNRKNKLRIEEYLNADSVNHGDYQSYFRNSLTKAKGKYVDGLKNGVWLHYDTLGKLSSKQSWFHGKQFGEQFFYRPDGQIENYYFMNRSGKVVYYAQFENSKIVKSKGIPFYIAYTGDSIQCNNEYVFLIFFGLPPGLKYKISIIEYLLPNREVVSTRDFSSMKEIEEVVWGKRIEISKIYDKPSTYEWRIGFTFYDEKRVVSDTSEIFKVQVVSK